MNDLKEHRTKMKVSQYRLAMLSNVARFKISNHELGYVEMNYKDLLKIEKALSSLKSKLAEVGEV